MAANKITIEELFLSIIDKIVFDKNNFQLKYSSFKEEKIIKNIYNKLTNDFIFNGNLVGSKLSTKQFNLISNFVKNNKDFVIKEKITSEEDFDKTIKEKITDLKIYESLERVHYADLVSSNLLGLYFPNSKYLKYEIKMTFENSLFDKDLNLYLIEIKSKDIDKILSFLKEHKFTVTKNLSETLNFYKDKRNISFVNLEKCEKDCVKLNAFNLDDIFVKILHQMDLENGS